MRNVQIQTKIRQRNRSFLRCFVLIAFYFCIGILLNDCPLKNIALRASSQASTFTQEDDEPANPFLNVFPDPTGKELYVNVYGLGNNVGTVFINGKVGPTGHQYSYTASYSSTEGIYVATVAGFAPGEDSFATLNLTTTTGIDSPVQTYPRAFFPVGLLREVQVDHGTLSLGIANPDTFANDTYLAFAPGFTLNNVVPDSHRIIGQSYTINASGSITASLRPMLLKFHYNSSDLQGAPDDTLAIFQWQPIEQQWLRLPSRVFAERNEVVTTILRFTAYTLMLTPTWHDDFDDLSGLEIQSLQNVDLTLKDGYAELLALTDQSTIGIAISKPITPAATIQQWDKLEYQATLPLSTTLTIDVLALDDTLLLQSVPNGGSLAAIDPLIHPSLRLRANFATIVPGRSAALDEWRVSWQQERIHYLYLPEVAR